MHDLRHRSMQKAVPHACTALLHRRWISHEPAFALGDGALVLTASGLSGLKCGRSLIVIGCELIAPYLRMLLVEALGSPNVCADVARAKQRLPWQIQCVPGYCSPVPGARSHLYYTATSSTAIQELTLDSGRSASCLMQTLRHLQARLQPLT